MSRRGTLQDNSGAITATDKRILLRRIGTVNVSTYTKASRGKPWNQLRVKRKRKSSHKQSHCSPSSTYSANIKARNFRAFTERPKACLVVFYRPTMARPMSFPAFRKGTRGGSFQSTRLHGEVKRDRLAPFSLVGGAAVFSRLASS